MAGKEQEIREEPKALEAIQCGRLLRSVPGRRAVYEGSAAGQEAIIKFFSSRLHGRRHCLREVRGLNLLAERGILCAKVLRHGKHHRGWFLAVEKINNAQDVNGLLKTTTEPDRIRPALESVLERLADMHLAGVLQRDLHLGNFLWDGTRVYVMDPAQMRFHSNPVHQDDVFRQLGNLATQLVPYDREMKKDLVEVYFQKRGWQFDDSAMNRIEQLERKAARRGLERTLKKTLRSCSDFIRHESGAWCGVFDRHVFDSQDLDGLMADLDRLMEAGDIFKRGTSCFVSMINVGGQRVVVKRYNHKGLWHSLRHTLKGSRAKRCWLFGHRLNRLNIKTATPFAFIEHRKNGILWKSYIMNAYAEGMTIRQLGEDDTLSKQQVQAVLEHIDSLLNRLIENRMTHGDLKTSNLIIADMNPVLIDLDSMRRHRFNPTLQFYAKKMKLRFQQGLGRFQHQR